MILYLYDGTFEGLLTAIYESYYRKDTPNRILSRDNPQQNLFDTTVLILTDKLKAEKVTQAIREKISPWALKNALCAFLSDRDETGTWIYQYLKMGWKIGKDLDRHLEDERVLRVHDLARKVRGESHRMLGLLRFRHLSQQYDVYYAPFEPDYNIVGMVAPHFVHRLNDQNWIIHDVKRKIGAVYNKKEWLITDLEINQVPPLSQSEIAYQNLWKKYYQSMSIRERYNLKLAKKNMPMKYWRYLVEKTP